MNFFASPAVQIPYAIPSPESGDKALERRRQAALDAYAVVDTAPEQAYDDIVRLAATLCGAPAAAIALLDRNRQWFKARIGMVAAETARTDAIGLHAIRHPERTLLVEDLAANRFELKGARFDDALLEHGPARFYAGVPLLSPDGHALGSLCVVDAMPRQLGSRQREGLAVLARQIQNLLELRRYSLEQRRLLVEREAFAQQLEEARADLQRRHDQLQHTATHDALTGLLNRAALAQLQRAPHYMARLEAAPYCLMLVDIDHFKQVNDRHGHLLGDRALRAVGDAVSASIREGDIAVRYGGEEFLVVLPATRLAGAAEVAERIRQRVAMSALPFALTVSAGIAAGEPTRDQPEQVFVRADQALYRAKAGGRNRVAIDDTPQI